MQRSIKTRQYEKNQMGWGCCGRSQCALGCNPLPNDAKPYWYKKWWWSARSSSFSKSWTTKHYTRHILISRSDMFTRPVRAVFLANMKNVGLLYSNLSGFCPADQIWTSCYLQTQVSLVRTTFRNLFKRECSRLARISSLLEEPTIRTAKYPMGTNMFVLINCLRMLNWRG